MSKEDEQVIVIDEELAFSGGFWEGLNQNNWESIVEIVQQSGHPRRRGDVESDPSVKQIGTYVVFQFGERYFLMQRKATHTDERLSNRFSLGIGGHLRGVDLTTDGVIGWMKREFDEEVSYFGNLKVRVLGSIYDNSDDVGKVHLGIVFLAEADSEEISLKGEHKSGKLATLEEIRGFYPQMENWSRMVFDYLTDKN